MHLKKKGINQAKKCKSLFEEWMWTLTPWSCNASYSNYMRRVTTTGHVYNSSTGTSIGVAPACLFSSQNLKLCRQAHLVGISDEND